MNYKSRFPIQPDNPDKDGYDSTYIPWWLAEEAYEEYAARYGTQQSLERLAERGGFGQAELLMLLRKQPTATLLAAKEKP